MVKKLWQYVKPFSSDTGTLRTDRRTDGQTDRFAISISPVSVLTRDKKWLNLAYFQTLPANFLLSRPNAAEYCNSEKNLLSTDGCSTRNATFRELCRTNPWDPGDRLLFLKSNRLRHALFPFARWQHCRYCCTVGFDMCIRRTRLFLSRISILTRDIDKANLSVRPSVTFRYQMKTA